MEKGGCHWLWAQGQRWGQSWALEKGDFHWLRAQGQRRCRMWERALNSAYYKRPINVPDDTTGCKPIVTFEIWNDHYGKCGRAAVLGRAAVFRKGIKSTQVEVWNRVLSHTIVRCEHLQGAADTQFHTSIWVDLMAFKNSAALRKTAALPN